MVLVHDGGDPQRAKEKKSGVIFLTMRNPGDLRDSSEAAEFLFCLFWGFFWLCHAAHRISVPRPGTEPASPVVETQSLNHWAAREV